MSYRTVKRLLGETRLGRKSLLVLGSGIFLLIGLSFLLYGYWTEDLVWQQTKLSAQLLVNPILLKKHWPLQETSDADPELRAMLEAFPAMDAFLKEFPKKTEEFETILPADVQYASRVLRPGTDVIDYVPRNAWERDALRAIQEERVDEVTEINQEQQAFRYLWAVRLRTSCLKCHPTAKDRELGAAAWQADDLIAALSIELPLSDTNLAVNLNRAIALSFAIGTAILSMLFVYGTIRYVIVKPLAHLKEVSEEVASGNIDVRSQIETGDEFQELSHMFNRMLRRLVSMQDELRKANADLDSKLDQLAQANMALFEMNRLKSEFLATISHELRTPLNSILGFSELIGEYEGLPAKQKRWIENIRSSGNLLLKLINDILDLAKLEAGKMAVHAEEFSLRDLVEGQIQMARPLADKKNIALEAEVDPSIPILKQDPHKLAQILSNLVSNAIKFTPEGGRIGVRCLADRAHVAIRVTDNGVGIAPEDQQLIFDKFRQAQSHLTREHGGTGLGLSIVRELTKLLGGDEVQLESELGRGSTFTVRLPMHYTEKQPMELTLAGEPLDLARDRQMEIRYYSAKPRPIGADSGVPGA